MPILASEPLLRENKKIQWQNVTTSGDKTWVYSHALLIPTKSSKSKNHVIHEQELKDTLIRTCPISLEVQCWTWNQRFIRGLGSIPTRGNILPLDFFLFSHSKASDANIGIIANYV